MERRKFIKNTAIGTTAFSMVPFPGKSMFKGEKTGMNSLRDKRLKMRYILIATFFLIILFVGTTAQTKVAGFRDDFSLYNSSSNWKYYWNKPDNWQAGSNPGDLSTVEIGRVSSYAPLISTGNMLTADGDENGGNSSPDAFIRLNQNGGHPGAPGTEKGLDRYTICAYTVSTPGNYYILNSALNITDSRSNGVLVYVHVNSGTPVYVLEYIG